MPSVAKGLLAAFAAVTLAGCGGDTPTAPSIIINNYNNNQNQNGGGSGGNGTPGSGSGTITRVKVTQYGENVTDTCSTPSGEDRSVRIGCIKKLTCTPFVTDSQGNFVPADTATHGPKPDYFTVSSGGDKVAYSIWSDNEFNMDVRGVKAGEATIICSSRGVPADPFVLRVIP